MQLAGAVRKITDLHRQRTLLIRPTVLRAAGLTLKLLLLKLQGLNKQAASTVMLVKQS